MVPLAAHCGGPSGSPGLKQRRGWPVQPPCSVWRLSRTVMAPAIELNGPQITQLLQSSMRLKAHYLTGWDHRNRLHV
ncbi:hypothetical protein JZ751_018447 [Albula glossodonta]|uniref:Uncharacterized protein n=1 Tax=Albula glossodonta TaxID=121402 RepID=A0A8T2MUE5_9TELE|nr:hypothetical protein JZ751_018447 [Albula glossodonta]